MPDNQKKIIEDDYLGDGVYVSFDGYHLVFDLRGQDNFTRIAMEPEVLEALDRYRARVSQACEELRAKAKGGGDD